MPAPTLVDALNSYIQGEKIKWNGTEPTPAQFANWAALWAMQYGPNGWPIGASDVQTAVDAAVKDFTELYNSHYPPPPPASESPLGYDFGDGSYAPTMASLSGKAVGDTTTWEGKTYKLVNYMMGAFATSPRWVVQP